MSFTRVLGPGIHTASNINSHNINSTGIITAVSFVGDGSGLSGVASTDSIITGTAATFNTYPVDINAGMTVAGVATFSGNLTVGGVLTYEDVKNVDSIGVVTARNGIDCNGDLDVDGHTNLDNVSIAGVTTTTGNIHLNSGAKVGFATDSNTFIGQDDYDRLDFNAGGKRLVSIVEGTNIPVLIIDKDGVNNARSNQGTNYNANPHATELVLGNTSSNNHGMTIVSPSSGYGNIQFSDGSGGGLDATRGTIVFTHSDNKLNLKSKLGSIALTHKDDDKLVTTDAGISIPKDLDVDGHTNLDNVSVAGVSTFAGNVNATGVVDVTGSIIVDHSGGGTGLSMNGVSGQTCGVVRQRDDVQHAIIFRGSSNADGSTITGGNTMEYREYGDHVFKTGAINQHERLRINSSGNAVFSGNIDANGDLDVDGHTNLDNVSIVGVATVTGSNINIEGGSAANSQFKVNSTGRYRGIQLDENGTRKAHFQHDATDNKTVVGTAEGTMQFNSGDTPRIILNSSGHWVPYVDSTYDLGLTGTRWRNVYADTLYGDGSNLTGITQTTINNNANNRLITGSGTANTLEGEQRLTYDGSQLSNDNISTNEDSAINIYKSTGDNADKAILRVGYNETNSFKVWRPRANADIYIETSQSSSDIIINTNNGSGIGQRVLISSTGSVRIGDSTNSSFSAHAAADDLVIGATSGSNGMTILTGSATGNIFFNDGSGNDGVVQYVHSSSPNYMRISSSGHIRFDVPDGISISDDNIAPTAGDMASGASFGIPKLHIRGNNSQSGAYELLARFQSGIDANDSGATIVLNHSNDRGLALQGGRGQSNRSFGAIKAVDNIGRLSDCIDFLGGNGQGVNYIRFFTGESSTTTERLRLDQYGNIAHTSGGSGFSYFKGSSEYIFGSQYSSPPAGGVEADFQVHTGKSRASMSINAYYNNAGAPFLQFVSSRSNTRGVLGTKSQANDYIGDIRFYGDNGTNYNSLCNVAQILVRQKSTISDGDTSAAGEFTFSTGNSTGGGVTEKFKIDSGGRLTQTSTDSFIIAKGDTSERPTGTVGMVRFNTETDQLENYTSAGWRNVNLKVPSITSISGEIYAGMPSNITINGNDFDGTVTVIFKEGSTTRATLTGQSVSSGSLTVTVPSGVYGQSVGDTITITITNSDGVVSTGSNKTIQSTPTGGTTSTSGNYRVHTFTSSGTLTAPSGWSTSYDYLVVAGGGSGGNNKQGSFENGGGGGAGGMLTGSSTLSAGSYSINIGLGGAIPGGDGQTKGGNTTAFGLTAIGGGGGRTRDTGLTNCNGGSGGGTTNWDDVNSPGSGTSGQGNRGGYATQVSSSDGGSGGGGGKGGVGGTGQSSTGANGGSGQASSISGSSVTYAGGGGGAGGTAGSGGSGGGGNAGSSSSTNGSNGQTNRGGGGGGNYAQSGNAGNGGSGIVIVRYKLI